MRPYANSLVDGALDRIDIVEFITAIPHRRDTRGQILRPPFGLLKMRMHIPQTR